MSSNPANQAMVDPFAAPPATYASGGAPAEGAGAGMSDVLRVIKQRLLLILIMFFVLYGLVVGTTVVIWKYAPAYPSEAMLELETPRKPLEVDPEPLLPDIFKQALQTEARKLKQTSLLLEVLERQEIKETDFYKWYGGDVKKAAFELQRLLVSAPIPDTNLIRVSLAIRDKKEAMKIVNAIVERYRARYIDHDQSQLFARVDGMKNTLADGQRRLRDKREEINRFRETAEVPALEEERTVSTQLIGGIQEQLIMLDMGIASYQADLDAIAGVPVGELPLTAEMRIIVESDPVLRYYRSTVESFDVQIRATGTLLGPNHRQIRMAEAQRQVWSEKELARREELISNMRERQIEALRQELAKYKSMRLKLGGQLADAQATQRDLDRNIQRYKQLITDETLLLAELRELQVRVAEGEHARQDVSRKNRLSVVQFAVEAIRPSRPDPYLFLGGGFVLAVAGAVGFAFLREFTDKAVRTPVDVARFGHISVLGNVPLIDDEEADVDSIELAVRKAPHSLVAEAFRQMRTNLLFSGPVESQRTILITSPGPGDGKTAIAINLAATLAHGNQRVLLIDCNFRRPALRTAFANTRREGLSNILIGQGSLEDYVTHTDVANVDVLSSGPMPPTPADLLGSAYMQELLAQAATKYDRVILDGPPALLISDAMVVARQVDGVIVVARAVTNTKGALKRTRDQLERIGARIFGAVLNGVQARAGGYFRRQYRDFYEYTADETIPAELPEPPAGEADDKKA